MNLIDALQQLRFDVARLHLFDPKSFLQRTVLIVLQMIGQFSIKQTFTSENKSFGALTKTYDLIRCGVTLKHVARRVRRMPTCTNVNTMKMRITNGGIQRRLVGRLQRLICRHSKNR